MPPSHELFFWKICMTTFGRRSSRNNVSRAWMKYASVYQPARIFSTGRSKISGWSLVLVVCAMFELEARGERRLRNLELLRRRLGRGEAVLQLVARLRERLRERVARMTGHPAEDLGRGGDRAELRSGASLSPHARGREPRKHVADRRRRDERADEVTAATFVLALCGVTVLVAADRDVLGAVIRRELAAAKRERRRRERQKARDQLLRSRPQAARLADAADEHRGAEHHRHHAAALHRQLRIRQGSLHLR